jgi:DNA replicative helicase MCM subunit Mcm2 (Cdc46/Mcm family)
MSDAIPDEISTFAWECVQNFDNTILDMKQVYNRKIFDDVCEGSGFCTKIETVGIKHKDAGEGKVMLKFNLSDGEYSIPCITHNANEKYLSGRMDDDDLAEMLMLLTESQKQGKRIEVTGNYINFGKKRVFVCCSIKIDSGFKESQMTDKQFKKFKQLCDKHKITPLDLAMRDDTLWAELYAQDFLKKAVLLFLLSPEKKQDMIHIGIVSSHGEGKDHLVERVIQPVAPCRMAGSGKMATIPRLFGAMSGDDLNAIEIGLMPKMNHERVAVSEFQTWGDETFGELMNMMANGKIEMQKGALDIQRETTLNLLFLGNPPHYYDEEKHNKKEMLAAFGQYTYQIISRLTLIFTQLSLSGADAKGAIRMAIIDSMDGVFEKGNMKEDLDTWRNFFKEYFRYVSHIKPKIRPIMPRINSIYDEMENRPQFKDAFCIRSTTDNRKYQEFANLVRGFARLHGDEKITLKHLLDAQNIFEVSLQTLTEEFPLSAMMDGVDEEVIAIYQKLLKDCPVAESLRDIRTTVKITNDQLDILIRSGAITKFENGAYFVNEGWGVSANE